MNEIGSEAIGGKIWEGAKTHQQKLTTKIKKATSLLINLNQLVCTSNRLKK